MFKLGCKKLSFDFTSEIFDSKKAMAKFASTGVDRKILPEFTPISHQSSIGSCVANAIVDAYEILKGLEDPQKVEQLSRLFVYYNARKYTNETDRDEGSHIPYALDSLKKIGVCREDLWSYDISKVFDQPNILSYKEASDNCIFDFYQIRESGSARVAPILSALNANHPVVFATQVDSAFQSYSGTQAVFGPPSSSIGNHAMIITGYRKNANNDYEFYIRNSWGSGFGISEPETVHLGGGHCWFSSEYVCWKETFDLFVPTRADNLLF